MGGNALSGTSVRLAKEDYFRMSEGCTAKLQALYPGKRIQAIEAYRSKADFGDLDILIESTGFDPFKAATALEAVEVVRNGPVTSVGVLVRPEVPPRNGNVFQVDFITSDPESFAYASSYFAHCDQGNLVGRIAHATGLSHRHDGLYYYHRDGDYKFREILLTKDYAKTLAFLDYDVSTFEAGFNTLEDMFVFVTSSSFFASAIFLLENRNAAARVRDRKRPTYTKFLKWCEDHPELPSYSFPASKTAWLPRIVEHFPHFQAEFDRATADLAELRAVKSKFNGDLVAKWTGLEGKELGQLMAAWRKKFSTPQDMHKAMLAMDLALLQSEVVASANELRARLAP